MLKAMEELAKLPPSLVVQYNTGTMFDIMTGRFREGVDGKWYLEGGMSNLITGLGGRNGMYKSTLMGSLFVRMLYIYTAHGILADSEYAIIRDMVRVRRFAGELGEIDESLIIPISVTDKDIDDLMTYIKNVSVEKLKNKKDSIGVTPFKDDVGKPMKAWMPTPVFNDSFSEIAGFNEDELVDTNGVTGKKTKTVYMLEGNNKTIFLRRVRRICETSGIVLCLTAHVDDNNSDISGPGPRKQMVHMKQSDALKNVGSSFKKLTNPYVHIQNCTLLRPDKTYTSDRFNDLDLNEVILTIPRSKTNMSGLHIPFIVSQSNGLLNHLSYYHYLRTQCSYWGFEGNNTTHRLLLYPSVTLSRTKARDLIDNDSKLRRALEITAQYKYIQDNWNLTQSPWFTLPPDEFSKRILEHPELGEKVLDTHTIWRFGKPDTNYLSIMDIALKIYNK